MRKKKIKENKREKKKEKKNQEKEGKPPGGIKMGVALIEESLGAFGISKAGFEERGGGAQAGGEGVTVTLSPSRNPRESSFSSGTFPPVGGDHPGYKTLRDFPGLGSGHLDLELG